MTNNNSVETFGKETERHKRDLKLEKQQTSGSSVKRLPPKFPGEAHSKTKTITQFNDVKSNAKPTALRRNNSQ